MIRNESDLSEISRGVYIDSIRSSTGKGTLSSLPRNKLALPVGLSAFAMAKRKHYIDKNIMRYIHGTYLTLLKIKL